MNGKLGSVGSAAKSVTSGINILCTGATTIVTTESAMI